MVAGAVGYMARAADGGGRAAELVTRDFLGGCVAADDARDAAAATARHDAVSGKVSLQKQVCPATPRDLNLFPVPGAAASAAKPCTSTAAAAPSAGGTTTYHSVCTIEKVKTALERFERGKHGHHQHQQQHSAGASPSSSSVTTSSVKRRGGGGGGGVEQGDGCDSPSAAGGSGMVAAACPRCFLYVLISRSDPRCPRCESHVPPPPSPAPKKKPRIDLNVGFLGT
ncbi:protein bunched, class 2/F/G isoform-like [Oryza brachyantha]|uniref:protein bunched, class 2/F/G isoform-like n=1 Tax=Oryza brachyantha TaxID=4533 RepID=UPI001ADA2851|nr:protein bunched, class 2/F/G isoform-like [Oryza brachyantha]